MDQINELVRGWISEALVWIGFGTLVGLLAKAIMPGRDPGGAFATMAMGIGGVVVGCGSVAFFFELPRISPISPVGALVGTAGAFALLAFYRLMAGYFFTEGETNLKTHSIERARRRRHRRAA
jgi:uncharacterized membrane protein YeaQ/YmgE (transglycosylase-associated protein family)